MTRNVISLTSIPPRMDRIGPTLTSLVQQTAPIDAVILWVPQSYRRADFGTPVLPDVPDGVEIRRCDRDYGPATKVLPTVQAYGGQDVRILYCDDDRIYHPNWAQTLLEESDRHPAACIAEAGEVVSLTRRKAFQSGQAYRWLRLATLGGYGAAFRRKNRALDPGTGVIDIAKGYGGVLVRPEFFGHAAYDIPDLLWTVDDIWLSGQLALNQVAVRKVGGALHSDKSALADVEALEDLTYAEHDRHKANMACIRYFQDTHGIWTD